MPIPSQGGKTGAVQKCVACRGRGMRIMIRQLAPGMVQQMQSVCTDCNGEGEGLACCRNSLVWVCLSGMSSPPPPLSTWKEMVGEVFDGSGTKGGKGWLVMMDSAHGVLVVLSVLY